MAILGTHPRPRVSDDLRIRYHLTVYEWTSNLSNLQSRFLLDPVLVRSDGENIYLLDFEALQDLESTGIAESRGVVKERELVSGVGRFLRTSSCLESVSSSVEPSPAEVEKTEHDPTGIVEVSLLFLTYTSRGARSDLRITHKRIDYWCRCDILSWYQ